MGVLFAVGLQLLIPFATCFPGMIYRVINPNLENPDAAYPMMVAAVVPVGLRAWWSRPSSAPLCPQFPAW